MGTLIVGVPDRLFTGHLQQVFVYGPSISSYEAVSNTVNSVII